jgi:protein-L-isoaspartate(D-aspartate) O-methyltransferase
MDFAAARFNMVENQIRTTGVTDPVLVEAMAELPREAFVPETMAGIAYIDESLSLGNGRYLMEPMVLARLLQAAEIGPVDTVLDVGCASGYSAAVLSRLAGVVVAVENDKTLVAHATKILSDLGLDNVAVIEGPFEAGYTRQSPYDAILTGGAVAEIPEALTKQLANGGRLVCVIDDGKGPGRATLVTRFGDAIHRQTLFEAGIAHLPGFEPRPMFQF